MASEQLTPVMIAELKSASPIHNDLAEELAEKWGVSIHAVRAAAVVTEGVEYVRLPSSTADAPGRSVTAAQSNTTRPPIVASSARIVDYQILSSKGQAALAQEVRDYINIGWSPLGGVSAAAFGISPVGGNQYLQAMVKYSI